MTRQINSDFNYFELLQLVPKISQYTKALRAKNIILKKENQYVKPYILIKKQNSEISAEIELNSKINEFSEINREISDVIDQASKHAASSNDIFDSLNSEENTDDRIHQKQIISILNVTKTYNNEKQTHGIARNTFNYFNRDDIRINMM
ncbi:hypothetical protein RhiirA5_382497 [Rhizophagus irregularis]|uniref:Uncharacterized protein n=1 Tax=Rhizophagus irregularis TaxID=588596 RepID=A0A2N0P0N2_9GLOM|nr:hypothetical protein RhiirA5_382497 [Rhizophagus irregularis]GET57535.1 hypothetical protein GLOIN_2v1762423 [Rhizophagus irregularis DAOM 181602=DAOM 197198]